MYLFDSNNTKRRNLVSILRQKRHLKPKEIQNLIMWCSHFYGDLKKKKKPNEKNHDGDLICKRSWCTHVAVCLLLEDVLCLLCVLCFLLLVGVREYEEISTEILQASPPLACMICVCVLKNLQLWGPLTWWDMNNFKTHHFILYQEEPIHFCFLTHRIQNTYEFYSRFNEYLEFCQNFWLHSIAICL